MRWVKYCDMQHEHNMYVAILPQEQGQKSRYVYRNKGNPERSLKSQAKVLYLDACCLLSIVKQDFVLLFFVVRYDLTKDIYLFDN